MAEGIRIRHHTRVGQMLPVPLFKEMLPNLHLREPCQHCGVVHPCKVVHLELDSQGCAIISVPLWDKFRTYPNYLGFRVANTVATPPTQGVSMQTMRIRDIVSGINVGGILAKDTGPVRAIFDIGGNGAKDATKKAEVDLRTVTIEEYFELMARHGVGTDRAGQILMRAFVNSGPAGVGAN